MRYKLASLLSIFLICSCGQNGSQGILTNHENLAVDLFSPLDSLSLAVENIDIPSGTLLTNVASKEVVSLESLKLDNSLVLYLSEIQCSACISQEMDMLKAHYDPSEVTLLCDYQSMRDLKLYLLINKIEFPAYIVHSEFPVLIRSLTNPTYFRLGSNYRPSSVFFASYSAKEKSNSFHQAMSVLLKNWSK